MMMFALGNVSKKCGLLDPRRAILYLFSFSVPSQYSFRQKTISAFARHVSFCQRRASL